MGLDRYLKRFSSRVLGRSGVSHRGLPNEHVDQGTLGNCFIHSVEEKFTKFSGEPRDARENLCKLRPHFGRILMKIDAKSQGEMLPDF